MGTQDTTFKTVDCPKCSVEVALSLPRSATIASIVAGSQNITHDTDDAEIERRREHEKLCSNDHRVSVVYDW